MGQEKEADPKPTQPVDQNNASSNANSLKELKEDEQAPTLFQSFSKNLGGFILKNNLGGRKSAEDNTDFTEEETLHIQRQRAIDDSRQAREHFFTQEYSKKIT